MKRKIAKRAFGIAMTSAMVVTSVGNIPGLSLQETTKVKAAGASIYVDDVNYYDVTYDEGREKQIEVTALGSEEVKTV